MYKILKQNYIYKFDIRKSNLYIVEIEASCKQGAILGLFGGQDLKVEIDDHKFREVPAMKRAEYFNVSASWNGTHLKGQTKIIFFILHLEKGEHTINFIPKKGAKILKEPVVKLFNQQDSVIENRQAEDGNRYSWITVCLVDLPLNFINTSVRCEKRDKDSDDLKMIVNGRIEKNKDSGWWGKNWYWQGSQMKSGSVDTSFCVDLDSGVHCIEFWADRMPVLNSVKIDIGLENRKLEKESNKEDIRKYTHRGLRGNQDYNRYDKQIKHWTSHWNNIFLQDKYPVEVPLDPSLVKAIVYQESKIGFYPGGEIDVMQVGNDGDPAIETLNGKLEEWWMKDGKIIRLDYEGDASADSIDQSLKWGIRWLYHKAQGIRNNKRYWKTWKEAVFEYGPNTKKYTDNVWSIYKNGLDKSKKGVIKLLSITLLMTIGSSSFVYYNQGQVYFKYIDIGEEHVCVGRARLEIGVLDGFRIKKAVIGPVNDRDLSSYGMIKTSIKVDNYDFDNDGVDDILVSAKHAMGSDIMYFFRIGDRELEPIEIKNNHDTQLIDDNSFFAENINFGKRDKYGRYSFVTKGIVNYRDGDQSIFRAYYGFNDIGTIEFIKDDIEYILAVNK